MTAAAWAVGLHLLTQHAPGCNAELRTFTPGVYAVSPDGVTVGVFRNSYGHASTYAGWTLRQPVADVTVGVMAYRFRYHTRWTPMVTPSLKLGDYRVSYVAPFRGSSNAIHISWEKEL